MTPNRRRFLTLGAGTLAMAMTGGGCSSGSSGPIKFATNPWPGYDLLYVARDKGFFKENGLDVDLRIIEDASIYMAAVASGDVDFTAFSVNTVAGLYSAGRLRPLAVTGPSRSKGLPEVPTMIAVVPSRKVRRAAIVVVAL